MEVRRLSNDIPFGVTVHRLDRNQIRKASIMQDLRDLWIREGLIIFRDGPSNPAFQVDLSRCFGELQVHPVAEMVHPECKELFVAKGGDGALLDVNGTVLGGYIPWHSDQVFTVETNHGGILRVAHQPEQGGNTGFVDQISAYDALSDDMKQRIDRLDVVYALQSGVTPNFRYLPHQRINLVRAHPFQSGVEQRIAAGGYPPVVHPLVFTQPETGRKVLNLSPMFACSILGMGPDESHELLWTLAKHLTDESRAYDHEWRPGDLVLWDNWRMIHCARGVPDGMYREVHRTSIAGDYALGRLA